LFYVPECLRPTAFWPLPVVRDTSGKAIYTCDPPEEAEAIY